ncbi:MAG: hypothetical protein DYG95_29250 [Chlorobi bacterium CHB1]|nr:hypothetical protein [Chlorobi bacterium CHB1]
MIDYVQAGKHDAVISNLHMAALQHESHNQAGQAKIQPGKFFQQPIHRPQRKRQVGRGHHLRAVAEDRHGDQIGRQHERQAAEQRRQVICALAPQEQKHTQACEHVMQRISEHATQRIQRQIREISKRIVRQAGKARHAAEDVGHPLRIDAILPQDFVQRRGDGCGSLRVRRRIGFALENGGKKEDQHQHQKNAGGHEHRMFLQQSRSWPRGFGDGRFRSRFGF